MGKHPLCFNRPGSSHPQALKAGSPRALGEMKPLKRSWGTTHFLFSLPPHIPCGRATPHICRNVTTVQQRWVYHLSESGRQNTESRKIIFKPHNLQIFALLVFGLAWGPSPLSSDVCVLKWKCVFCVCPPLYFGNT